MTALVVATLLLVLGCWPWIFFRSVSTTACIWSFLCGALSLWLVLTR